MGMATSIAVLVISQDSLLALMSMCIAGATIGVGLCGGTLKAISFRRMGLLMPSRIATIPVAGTLADVLMGLFLNTPHFES